MEIKQNISTSYLLSKNIVYHRQLHKYMTIFDASTDRRIILMRPPIAESPILNGLLSALHLVVQYWPQPIHCLASTAQLNHHPREWNEFRWVGCTKKKETDINTYVYINISGLAKYLVFLIMK